MVVNYISENISHLVEKSKLTQDDFGDTFGLKRGAINSYVRKIAIPKIETIQKICNHSERSPAGFLLIILIFFFLGFNWVKTKIPTAADKTNVPVFIIYNLMLF